MNLDETVTLRESCRRYLPEPQLRPRCRAPYKVKCSHRISTNILRYCDTSRYTFQALGLAETSAEECLSPGLQSRSLCFAVQVRRTKVIAGRAESPAKILPSRFFHFMAQTNQRAFPSNQNTWNSILKGSPTKRSIKSTCHPKLSGLSRKREG